MTRVSCREALQAAIASTPMPSLAMPTVVPRSVQLKSAEQVQADFDRRGVSFSEWARSNGFTVSLVYSVLNGAPCKRGKSHRIAVLLGMKHGVAQVEGSRK